jgi:hypothetical protein
MSRDAAVKAGEVGLRFADGEVGVMVQGGVPTPRSLSSKPAKPASNQGSLFGE